ncbi:MAG: type II secretion system major pseudopilin GspG [Thiobacillus sp.]|nr:type II secretion system major pseudopilin GspG [Thiobacillus sp.]
MPSLIQKLSSFPRRREPSPKKRDSRLRGNDKTLRPCLLQRGFTLIELMVVLVILGVLAALIAPKLMDRPDEARVIAAKQDVATIVQALKLYRLDNLRYPSTGQGLQALVAKPTTEPLPTNWKAGGYLEKLPNDPWGHAYLYLSPGRHGEIDVFSQGADGQPGGEGNDADIGNWLL